MLSKRNLFLFFAAFSIVITHVYIMLLLREESYWLWYIGFDGREIKPEKFLKMDWIVNILWLLLEFNQYIHKYTCTYIFQSNYIIKVSIPINSM